MFATKVLLTRSGVFSNIVRFSRCCAQLGSGSYLNFANRMLQICVQPLLGLELRAVAGQVEQFNVLFVLCRPP